MTINGISTCTEAGTEKYERFQLGIGRRKRTLVQYDYRHPTNGELFSCVKPTLDECRAARDKWLTAKEEVLDGIFDDAEAWGVDTLKGWIDDYESCRFTAIDSHTAVITSEYNMECLMEWLKRNTPIAEITEC